MADPKLNIGIQTTADTSGIEKVEKAIKDLGAEAGQTSNIIDATGARPASLEQLAAMYMRDAAAAAEFAGRSRLATDATHALEVETVAATAAGSKYSGILNIIGRSLGSIIGRDLNKFGIEGIGRVIEPQLGRALSGLAGGSAAGGAAVAAEGAAASGAAVAFSALGIAIGSAVAAGAALVAGAEIAYLNNQTEAAKKAGQAFDDYITKRNKGINEAPTGQDATTDAIVNARIRIGELQETLKKAVFDIKNPLRDASKDVDEFGNSLNKFVKVGANYKDTLELLKQATVDLALAELTAANQRDARPRTNKENLEIAKVQQEFNQAAYDALPPLLQQAQAAANLDKYIKDAKDSLANLQGGQAPSAALLADVKSAEDLNDLITKVGDTGARTMVAGFAQGALKIQEALEKAKEGVEKINKQEADDQKSSADKIVEDQQKLAELGVSQAQVAHALAIRNGEITKSKNAGATAALRALAYDKETGKTNEEIKRLTEEILASQLEIEASKKRQVDAAKQLKDFEEQQKIAALPQGSQQDIKEISSHLGDLSKLAPATPELQQNLADNTSALKALRTQIESGIPLTHAGDVDNPQARSEPSGPSKEILAENRADNESRLRVLRGQVEDGTPLTHAGDAENPFGAAADKVVAAVRQAQQDAATAMGPIEGAITDLGATYKTSFDLFLTALQDVRGQIEKQGAKAQSDQIDSANNNFGPE